jgi:hypothetical protein
MTVCGPQADMQTASCFQRLMFRTDDRLGACNTFLTLVRQNQPATPRDSHENPMLDPESSDAEQLANALRHHQKNLVETDKAEKNVEVSRQLVDQLETMSDSSNQDA